MFEYFCEEVSVAHSMNTFPLDDGFVDMLKHKTWEIQGFEAAQYLHQKQVSRSCWGPLFSARKENFVDELKDQLELFMIFL